MRLKPTPQTNVTPGILKCMLLQPPSTTLGLIRAPASDEPRRGRFAVALETGGDGVRREPLATRFAKTATIQVILSLMMFVAMQRVANDQSKAKPGIIRFIYDHS